MKLIVEKSRVLSLEEAVYAPLENTGTEAKRGSLRPGHL